MRLNVLQSETAAPPWYGGGLRFTCTQCGNCCSGPQGYVWISREEIIRLGEFLGISPEEVVEQYCRKVAGKFSLREVRNPSHGGYDCIFLKEQPAVGKKPEGKVVNSRRGCSIYPVRPLQCRTWPFWAGNLQSPKAWQLASLRCPGMNNGRQFSPAKIEALRDAEDWPKNPPGSRGKNTRGHRR